MLPQNRDTVREISAGADTNFGRSVQADLKFMIEALGDSLANSDDQREVTILQGYIRCLKELSNRYSKEKIRQ